MSVTFTVDGEPIPKGRPRVVRGGRTTFTPTRTTKAEKAIGLTALAAGVRRLTGDVAIDVTCYRSTARRYDIDNAIKTVLDGLNGVAWADDSQVTDVTARKRIDKARPRTVIAVGPVLTLT